MAVKTLLATIVRIIWVTAILVIIVAASYESLGRVMLPRLPQYQQQIEEYVSDRLGSDIKVGSMTGNWDNFQPIVDLQGVSLSPPDSTELYIVRSIHLQLDVLGSLLAWQPVFSALEIAGVEVTATQDTAGGWSLGGLFAARGSTQAQPLPALGRALDLLLSQGHIVVRDSRLELAVGDQTQSIQVDSWKFDCIEEFCSSTGRIRFEEEQESQLQILMNLSDFGEGEDFKLEAFLDLDAMRLEKWVPLLNLDTPINFSWDRFQLGGKVWLTWEGDGPTDIRGSVSSSELGLTPGGEQLDPVQYISSDFVWQKNSGRANELWSLWLNDFTFRWKDELFEPAQQRWSMSEEDSEQRLHIVADSLDLAFTNNTLLAIQQLPKKIRGILATLSPRGRLVNAHVTYVLGSADREDARPDIQLEAELEDVGVSAWRNVPAGSGIDGYLHVTPNGGMVDFRSTNLAIHFPRFYSESMRFDQATGLVNWRNKGRGVWLDSGLISLVGLMGTVEGHFSAATPRDGAESRFEMLLALRDAEVREALKLVPDQRVDEGLLSWLEGGLVDGRANRGSFIYSGTMRKGAPRELNSMRLMLEMEDVEFSYHSEWPALTGLTSVVEVTQESAEIHATEGRLLDLEFDLLDVSWRSGEKNNIAKVTSHVRGSAADGIKLLTDTPVRDALFDLIDDFSATGAIEADIDLEIPIGDELQPRVNLSLEAADMQLEIPSLGLAFDDISGQFEYSTETGISCKNGSASLFNRPIAIEISSTAIASPEGIESGGQDQSEYSTTMVMRGELDAASLYDWEPLPIFTRLYGKTGYEAVLDVSGAGTNKLIVTSDLEGITFDAPEPFGKVAAENTALRYEIELGDTQIHRLGYADLLQTALVLEDGSYDRGEVRLGPEPANFEDVPGISVRGTVDQLRLLDWWDFFTELYGAEIELAEAQAPDTASKGVADEAVAEPDATTESPDVGVAQEEPEPPLVTEQEAAEPVGIVSRLKEIEITVDNFIFGEQRLANLILQMEQIEQDWWAHLENETLKGRVRFFADTSKPSIVELDYLHLPEGDGEEDDPLVDIVPQDIPAFDFSVDALSLGEDDYGRWVFNYRPSSTGARLEQLIADVKGLQLDGELAWNYVDSQHGSGFRGTAHSRNLNKMMTAWGYPNTMKGKSLNISADLTWPGSPAGIAPERVTGPLSLAAGEGRFLDMDSMPEILKVLGVFNLSSIARRGLDSEVLKKGLTFDNINAELVFSEGLVSTQKSLIINGPSVKLKADGTTDLINETFDHNLVVVLPISENIPIAATVLGVPQVGIPLWLLNKAFGNMFDAFQSVEYRMTGPIADPLLETTATYEKRISESGGEANAAADGATPPASSAPTPES